jgi:hypothetical protein
LSLPNTFKKEPGSTQLGVQTKGRFHNTPSLRPKALSLLPAAHLRPRDSTETSRLRTYVSATVRSSCVPYTCKQESGSNPATQLDVPTRGRFDLNLAITLFSSILHVAHPRPRCSIRTSRYGPYDGAAARWSVVCLDPEKGQMGILLLVDTTIEDASPSHARQE